MRDGDCGERRARGRGRRMRVFAGVGAFGAVMALGAGQVASGLTITVSTVTSPTVTAPAVTTPTVTVPKTPAVTTPTVTVPKIPAVTTPTVTVPRTPRLPSTPTASTPVSAPKTTPAPRLSLPSTPRLPSTTNTSPIGGTRQSAPASALGGVPLLGAGGPAGAVAVGGQPIASSGFDLRPGSPALATGELAALARGGVLDSESLAAVLSQLQGCFYAISAMERRVLMLRSGLGGGPVFSRRAAGRVLGMSTAKVGRLERRGLRTLAGTAAHGGCVAGNALADVPAPLAILWSAVSPHSVVSGGQVGPGQLSGGTLAAVAPDWSSLRPASMPWGTLAVAIVAIGILTGIALILGGTTLRRRRRPPPSPLTLVQAPRESELFARRDDEIAIDAAARSGRRVAAVGRVRSRA